MMRAWVYFSAVIACVSLGIASSGWAQDEDHSVPWEKEMAAFAQADAELPTAPGGVVFVGSSSVRLWDLAMSFPDAAPTPLNRGFGGSQLNDSIRNADLLILKHKPRLVVLYAGDNDIAAGKDAKRVAADFHKLVAVVHKQLPDTTIAYIAIKPSIARWKLADTMRAANEKIAQICAKDDRTVFVDVWKPMLGEEGKPRAELFREDGLHLNNAGYKLWASLVRSLLVVESEKPSS